MSKLAELVIAGRKKGSSGGATEAANTLRSEQRADVVLLLSEGECIGPVNGLKSIYLDKVAVQNSDDSYNFEGVRAAWTVGTQGQAAIDGFNAVQNEIGVGAEVTFAAPLVRSISGAVVDKVRVTLSVPQLTEQDTNTGSVAGSAVEFAIDVQSAGTGFVERYRRTLSGKNTSPYTFAAEVELEGVGPFDVRVRRITPEPVATNIVNRFGWASYTEITSVKLRYPHSAVLALSVAAQPFTRPPEVWVDWMGMLFEVPSNFDPYSRTYTGQWDGTFRWAWTNDPAWVFRGLITHPRFGLGDLIDANLVNKWTLYRISQYCNGQVPDGRGGMEPRFAINCQVTERKEAIDLLRELATVFRGMVFWSGAGVDFAQDAPDDAALVYTPANVVGGKFTYSDVSEKTRHSAWICYWNDGSQFGESVPEALFDDELIARNGLRELPMRVLGVTSRGQAARVCRWARYTEGYESDVASFAVGSEGAVVAPGRRFLIADPSESGEQFGGRIHAASAVQIELDREVTLRPGETYTLRVQEADAVDRNDIRTVARMVTSPSGTTRTLRVATPFDVVPAPATVWLLESSLVTARAWRCVGVEEDASGNAYRITGVASNSQKFAHIEEGLKLDPRPISRLRARPQRPGALTIVEREVMEGQISRVIVHIGWPMAQRGLSHVVSWRHAGGAWTDLPITSENWVELMDPPVGVVDIEVRARNVLGVTSLPSRASYLSSGAGHVVAPGTSGNLLSNSEYSGNSAVPAVLAVVAGGCVLDALTTDLGRNATSPWTPPGCNTLVLHEQGSSNEPLAFADVWLEGPNPIERPIAVLPGQRLEFSAWMQAHRSRVRLILYYLDANFVGVLMDDTGALDVPQGDGISTALDRGYGRFGFFSVVPPGAAYVRPAWRKETTDAGQADSWAWLLRPYLGLAGKKQRVFSPYTPASRLIANGVGTELLAAGAVSATYVGALVPQVVAGQVNPMVDEMLLMFTPEHEGRLLVSVETNARRSTSAKCTVSALVVQAGSTTEGMGGRAVVGDDFAVVRVSATTPVNAGQAVTCGIRLRASGNGSITAEETVVTATLLKRGF